MDAKSSDVSIGRKCIADVSQSAAATALIISVLSVAKLFMCLHAIS